MLKDEARKLLSSTPKEAAAFLADRAMEKRAQTPWWQSPAALGLLGAGGGGLLGYMADRSRDEEDRNPLGNALLGAIAGGGLGAGAGLLPQWLEAQKNTPGQERQQVVENATTSASSGDLARHIGGATMGAAAGTAAPGAVQRLRAARDPRLPAAAALSTADPSTKKIPNVHTTDPKRLHNRLTKFVETDQPASAARATARKGRAGELPGMSRRTAKTVRRQGLKAMRPSRRMRAGGGIVGSLLGLLAADRYNQAAQREAARNALATQGSNQ